MLSLVLKDIIIQKKNLLVVLIYPIIGILAFGYTFTPSAAYVFSIISIVYIMIMTAGGYDEKNKFDIVLNSLPIKRNDAVVAKYLSVITAFLIGAVLTSIEGFIMKSTGLVSYLNIIKVSDIFTAACAICFYYAIYFPLNFKFGAIKMKFINILIYMFFIFVPMFIISINKENPDNAIVQNLLYFLNSLPAWGMKCVFAAAAVLVFLFSMSASAVIYSKKEF